MDNDTKHVLTILGLFACFGAGYFTCKAEKKVELKLGSQFRDIQTIEDETAGKINLNIPDEKIAVQNAVNAYYQTGDKYFYYSDDIDNDAQKEKTAEDKWYMIDDICYIDCNVFQNYIGTAFDKAMKEATDAKGYIIDLRDNDGGAVDACTRLLSNFLGEQTIGRKFGYDGSTADIKTPANDKKISGKVVVLVNENTASSAEIFAAAMKQFYPDTVLVGEKTFGKGIFQLNEYIGEKGFLRYTAGYYTIGDLQCYQGVGIEPDIEVRMSYSEDICGTDDDIQLKAALELFD